MKRMICAILALVMMLGLLSGCGEVAGEIAGNVAEAAKTELEKQVKAAFEKHKMSVLELKSSLGKLNGDEGELQFFCAVLVQSDTDLMPNSVADSLKLMFTDTGVKVQESNTIESEYLEHKELSFKYDKFEEGKTYYMVYCYSDQIPSLEDIQQMAKAVLEAAAEAASEAAEYAKSTNPADSVG